MPDVSEKIERTPFGFIQHLDFPNGIPYIISYFNKEGKRHKEDGPARTLFRTNGSIEREEWFLNHMHHRDDGPAFIEYDLEGRPTKEIWYQHDWSSRKGNGPRQRECINGKIVAEQYDNSSFGPSLIESYGSGEPSYMQWSDGGYLHREDGPASIRRLLLTRRAQIRYSYTSLYRRHVRQKKIPRKKYYTEVTYQYFLHGIEVQEEDLIKYKENPLPYLFRALAEIKDYERLIPLIHQHDPKLAKSLAATAEMI